MGHRYNSPHRSKVEIPFSGNATISEFEGNLEVVIPTKKNWFIVAFISFWLCCWAVAEIMVLGMLLGFGPVGGIGFASLFMLGWLCMWTIGGLFALRIFLWMLTGREVLIFGQGYLTTKKAGLLFHPRKTYAINDIQNLKVEESPQVNLFWGSSRNYLSYLVPPGTIRFDYGFKTIKVGSGLDAPEAQSILEKLKSKGHLFEKNFYPGNNL